MATQTRTNGKHPLDDQILKVREIAARYGWDGLNPRTQEPALSEYERLLLAQDWLRYTLVTAFRDAIAEAIRQAQETTPRPSSMPFNIQGWKQVGAFCLAALAAITAFGVGIGVGVVRGLGMLGG